MFYCFLINYLKLFTLRESLGIVFDLESKNAVNFFIFNYPNTTDQTISNIFQNNNYNFIDYINIEFPVLNYKFIGIQILNISKGFALLSTDTNSDKIPHFLIFKFVKEKTVEKN